MPGQESSQIRQRTLLRNICLTACFFCASIFGRDVKAADTPSVHQDRSPGAAAVELVMQALGLQGVNYRWGGSRPQEGLDCSGLVQHVYREAVGLILPRRSEDQSRAGIAIPSEELEPGDLVFFNTRRQAYSHVGIYIGSGRFVHAPSSGGQVRTEGLSSPYWRTRFDGARRIVTQAPLAPRAARPASVVPPTSTQKSAARPTGLSPIDGDRRSGETAAASRTGASPAGTRLALATAQRRRPASGGVASPSSSPANTVGATSPSRAGRPPPPDQMSSARSMVDPPGRAF